MTVALEPQNLFTTPIEVYEDGDPVNAAVNTPGMQALADQSLWNFYKGQAFRNFLAHNFSAVPAPDPGLTATYGWNAIAWSPTLGVFAAVNQSLAYIATSPDGDVWTAQAAATCRAICWAPELAMFVAVGDSGHVRTSTDGVTWSAQTAAENNSWKGICWSPELSLLVAVSSDGTNRVMTSANGTLWAAHAAAEANQWQDVTWAAGLGLFVAVANSGTHRVMTSDDGTNWDTQTAAAASAWAGVAWSEELSQLVAVAGGPAAAVMTSGNATAWASHSLPYAIDALDVEWIAELGLFVVAGQLSPSGAVAYSPDGETWRIRLMGSSGDNAAINHVGWSPDLGLLVLVTSATCIWRSMSGKHGDYKSSSASVGSWSDAVAKNVTSMVLPPGEWDVDGAITYPASNITGLYAIAAISETTASVGTAGDEGRADTPHVTTATSPLTVVCPTKVVIVDPGSTKTVYLVGKLSISGGTPGSAIGYIRARLAR